MGEPLQSPYEEGNPVHQPLFTFPLNNQNNILPEYKFLQISLGRRKPWTLNTTYPLQEVRIFLLKKSANLPREGNPGLGGQVISPEWINPAEFRG
jgi:hypothetical protein